MQDPIASAAKTGTLAFDSSGNLVNPATNVSGITFSGLSDGAANLNLNLDLFGATGTGNISQTAAASDLVHQSERVCKRRVSEFRHRLDRGNCGHLLKRPDAGCGTAGDCNGKQPAGAGGHGIHRISGDHGLRRCVVGVAGSGGRGTIEGTSLEASNVNISAEFSDLIVAQRAFEANSKAVTTFDTVTQETINMIH